MTTAAKFLKIQVSTRALIQEVEAAGVDGPRDITFPEFLRVMTRKWPKTKKNQNSLDSELPVWLWMPAFHRKIMLDSLRIFFPSFFLLQASTISQKESMSILSLKVRFFHCQFIRMVQIQAHFTPEKSYRISNTNKSWPNIFIHLLSLFFFSWEVHLAAAQLERHWPHCSMHQPQSNLRHLLDHATNLSMAPDPTSSMQ
jgi:hypothetical protein